MMQYRLSTLFMIFFVVAAAMALFGAWGKWNREACFKYSLPHRTATRFAVKLS